MSDYATSPDATTIRLQRKLPGPIERVWAYIVEPEKRALWFTHAIIEPRIGGKITATWDHTKLSHEPTPDAWKDFDGMVSTGTVTRYEPPRIFGYTSDHDGNESEVVIELEPRGDGVLLTLTQTKVGDAKGKASFGSGWHAYLAILEDRLAERKPRGFWTEWDRLQKEYEARLGA